MGFTKEIYDNLKNNFENNGYSIGAYYNEKDGYYYVYIETTSKDFNLGYIPDKLKNEKPEIYTIN